MSTGAEMQDDQLTPKVEFYAAPESFSAAAGAEQDNALSPKHIAAIQRAVTELVDGFRPPAAPEPEAGIGLESFEVELAFTVETGSGQLLKLIFFANAQASIKAKVVWSRKK